MQNNFRQYQVNVLFVLKLQEQLFLKACSALSNNPSNIKNSNYFTCVHMGDSVTYNHDMHVSGLNI